LCKLRDAAIGQDDSITHASPLSLVHFECLVDSLMALYRECTESSTLSKDRNVKKFIQKCKLITHQVCVPNVHSFWFS